MRTYPKHIKRALRELMAEAYERELRRELAKLDESFAAWRAGQISSGELSYRVHQYETGPSRKLFNQYNDRAHDMHVAYAIVVGILQREEVPAEVLDALSGPLNFYESLREQDELREPDEL